MKTESKIFLSLPASADYVLLARLLISGVGARLNYNIEQIEDMKVAVSEACTNVVLYAYDKTQTGSIDITCSIHPQYLEILVEDKGGGFNEQSLAAKKARVTDNDHNLGLGFVFIKSLMDEAEIKSLPGQGTVVRMVKKRPL